MSTEKLSKIERICEEWSKDCILNLNLEQAARETPQIHAKYIKIFSLEIMKHEIMKSKYNKLIFDKSNFYLEGPSSLEEHKEFEEKGWKLPASGKVRVKAELQKYLDTDIHIIELGLKLAEQKQIVDILKDILSQINRRSYLIGSAIEAKKFDNGATR